MSVPDPSSTPAFRLAYAAVMSALMAIVMSGAFLIRAHGLGVEMLRQWPSNALFAWVLACPLVLVVSPLVRRLALRVLVNSRH